MNTEDRLSKCVKTLWYHFTPRALPVGRSYPCTQGRKGIKEILGLPKPIRWTLEYASVVANAYQAPLPGGAVPVSQLYRHDMIFSAMPMFHVSCINFLSALWSWFLSLLRCLVSVP